MTRLIGGTISDTPIKDIGDGSAFSAGGGAETDPLFANVELLLMPEAGDASILDKSSNARTVTNTGPVSIVSDVASPTGYAMDFGTEANWYHLTFSDDAGLKAGTGDYCIETIALSTNTTSGQGSMTGAGAFTGDGYFFPWFYSTAAGPYGYPGAIQSNCNNTNVTSSVSGVTWNSGAYHHWAFTRSGTTIRIFCDGYEEVSGTDSTNIGYLGTWIAFRIGSWTATQRVFAGKIAMFRLTIGAARYTSNFSPFSEFPKA